MAGLRQTTQNLKTQVLSGQRSGAEDTMGGYAWADATPVPAAERTPVERTSSNRIDINRLTPEQRTAAMPGGTPYSNTQWGSLKPNWGDVQLYAGGAPTSPTTVAPRGTTGYGGGGTSTVNTAGRRLTMGGFVGGNQFAPPAPEPQQEIGQATTTTWVPPEGGAPELKPMDPFTSPEYDKRAVSALRQRHAAPGVRSLRKAVQSALTRSYANPNVRRLAVRDALAGYGVGLGRVMAGAQASAAQEYGAVYQREQAAAQISYQQQAGERIQTYNRAWDEYMKSATQKTTTTKIYGTPAEGAIKGTEVTL